MRRTLQDRICWGQELIGISRGHLLHDVASLQKPDVAALHMQRRRLVFQYLKRHLLLTSPENIAPPPHPLTAISSRVTKSGQVVLPPKKFDATVTAIFERLKWKFKDIVRQSAPRKRIGIWDLGFQWFKVGFCYLKLTCGNGTKKKQFPAIRIRYANFSQNDVILEHCWWSRRVFVSVTFPGSPIGEGYPGSPEVGENFLLITHGWKELEMWTWSHCVCLVTMHGLICNLIY